MRGMRIGMDKVASREGMDSWGGGGREWCLEVETLSYVMMGGCFDCFERDTRMIPRNLMHITMHT